METKTVYVLDLKLHYSFLVYRMVGCFDGYKIMRFRQEKHYFTFFKDSPKLTFWENKPLCDIQLIYCQ
jgi:hypothetical protein